MGFTTTSIFFKDIPQYSSQFKTNISSKNESPARQKQGLYPIRMPYKLNKH